jgi:hypothetical protein
VPKIKKSIQYRGKYFYHTTIFPLMTCLSHDGYTVTLRCFKPRQWEFTVSLDGYYSSGIGASAFFAAQVCFWNWKHKGLAPENAVFIEENDE